MKTLRDISIVALQGVNVGLVSLIFLVLLWSGSYRYWHTIGNISNHIAVVMFALSLLPGIAKRLSIHTKYIQLYSYLLSLRRHIGIMTFLLSVVHALCSYILPNQTVIGAELSDWMGIVSLIIMLPLFITSNDASMRILKSRWKSLHKLVHLIVVFLFVHILLKGSGLTVLIAGTILIFDALSWLAEAGLLQDILNNIHRRS